MVDFAEGFWLDHSRPRVLDATITLPIDKATLLVSGLTLVITLATSSFWNISAVVIHRLLVNHRGTGGQQLDAVDLQQQVMLRNPSTATGIAFTSLFTLRPDWSKKGAPRLWPRTLALVGPAVVVWIGFTAASLLVPKAVFSQSYDTILVRAKTNNCGFWSFTGNTLPTLAARNTKVLNDTLQARAYVSSFYLPGPSSSSSYGLAPKSVFPLETLEFDNSTSASCPFPNKSLCIPGHSGAFSMTSKQLDSHTMLGINAPQQDRVSVQMSVTCSPLTVRNFVTQDNTSLRFEMGPIQNTTTYTYLYPLQYSVDISGYIMWPVAHLAGDPNPAWQPIPDLNRVDADISIYFLSQNSLGYLEPVFDPFFSANGTFSRRLSGLPHNISLPDHFVNVMGCADQYVVCNPVTGSCSPPDGFLKLEHVRTSNSLGLNTAQLATLARIELAMANTNTYNSVAGLSTNALFANTKVFNLISSPLPDTQWQLEAIGWFQTSLAKLQAYIVEFVSNGPSVGEELGPYGEVISPFNRPSNSTTTDEEAQWSELQSQCGNQLIQSSGEAQNFSFLSVMIVACVCLVIVLIDWVFKEMIFCRGSLADSAVKQARQADDQLHLLRMALGGVGVQNGVGGNGDSTEGGIEGGQNGGDGKNAKNNIWDLGKKGVPVTLNMREQRRPRVDGDLVTY